MIEDGLEVLRAMRMGVSYYFTISVRAFSLVMRPLSQSEFIEITAEVQSRLKRSPENYQNRISEELLMAKQILMKASTSDVGKNDPKITEYILDLMTIDEILAFYKQYNAKVDELNPALEEMTQDKIQQCVANLKKKSLSPNDLSIFQLRATLDFFLTQDDSPEDK